MLKKLLLINNIQLSQIVSLHDNKSCISGTLSRKVLALERN